MSDKDNFEKKLLSELRQVSAENPAPATKTEPTRARPYGRFAAAGAGLAAVVAGVAIYTSTGDNTPSAYAVAKDSDGKVSVEITNLEEAGGLEESLKAAGVPAKVKMTAAVPGECAVELTDGERAVRKSAEGEDEANRATNQPLKATPPVPTSGPTAKAVPVLQEGPTERAISAKPTVEPPIELKRADAEGASFSIDVAEIEEGETVIISPSTGEVTKAVPAGVPSAPPIEIRVAEPTEGC